MQPEHTEAITQISHTSPNLETQRTTQHGLDDHHDHSASRLPLRTGGCGEPESPASDANSSSSPLSAELDTVVGRGLRRLSPEESPLRARSAVNRIANYEKALSLLPKRKYEGPGFKVIAKSKKSGEGSSAITSFPNEVLTHILSHLEPSSLSAVSQVSRRFHGLVTTPHAWRIAFSRFFPGPDALLLTSSSRASSLDNSEDEQLRSEKRAFTRLTTLASWRSEYILRTRLLRSLARGKPAQNPQGARPTVSPRSAGHGHSGHATVTYNSQLFTSVNHMHATFGTGLNKRLPCFIHGANETGSASSSDPNNGKVDNWGSSDPQNFLQHAELFPGDAQWGLGSGSIVGVPNVMDVSQPFGMVHGEGSPGGQVYYRSTEELRGRFLAFSLATSEPELGIPKVHGSTEAICSIWIAKSSTIPSLTDGVIGIMSGSSSGVVTAYSLGMDGLSDQRFGRGELTARWVVSPGVPIIAIAVDDMYSAGRQSQGRIWATILNALGEVFYLTDFPVRPFIDRGSKLDESRIERVAWEVGRSVNWILIEPSRRVARPNPYAESNVDGSYSPRSSWNGMRLSKEQMISETREIEQFLEHKPMHFRKICEGWDMRRKLEIDFAGDDRTGAGESVLVIACGLDETNAAGIKRYTRCNTKETNFDLQLHKQAESPSPDASPPNPQASLFGAPAHPVSESLVMTSASSTPQRRTCGLASTKGLLHRAIEEWRSSDFALSGTKSVQIMVAAIDQSTYATITMSEDPLVTMSGVTTASSPLATPAHDTTRPFSPSDVPGQRARFIAIGTKTGSIIVWNMRAPTSNTAELTNSVDPIRVIFTDSPQISCLALSSLHLVHGGNDGLVQTWDPLASNTQPIRTLNSRFSSRARRRLVQAEASAQGVGINLFAAGSICLDPDPTVLRGMVSLGTHLLYWSYSSSAADQYKSKKRCVRRSERGSNNGGERFSGTGRGVLKDYIANEKYELEKEKERKRKEADRLTGRFGVDLLGPDASEEELLAYAQMLSEEAHAKDLKRSGSENDHAEPSSSACDNGVALITGSVVKPQEAQFPIAEREEELDPDIAKAIRLSLGVNEGASNQGSCSSSEIPFRYDNKQRASSMSPPKETKIRVGGSSKSPLDSDLDFALQLSLAEERSRMVLDGEEFPSIDGGGGRRDFGKGKGKRRAS
ncbi:MAG: hypothetical protein M1827_002478 [Pycnora praestabilis]|nr:MAG: hypothetical protein M1827_002478 [Pycnora praestabilis]